MHTVEAFFFITSGTTATYPFWDNSATEAQSGIPANYSFPTTPGNPNSRTTTQASSRTVYTIAAMRTRRVRVHGIHEIGNVAGTCTVADHNGNQAEAIVMAAGASKVFDTPIEWNKGIRATASAGGSIFMLVCSEVGVESRQQPG